MKFTLLGGPCHGKDVEFKNPPPVLEVAIPREMKALCAYVPPEYEPLKTSLYFLCNVWNAREGTRLEYIWKKP